ncbi:MAG: penicillin-binding protein activator [Rickettsiales bacterium]|jgi:ABC-type branched-subunit amino acid transport system substrate-binding protein|nr:penicillin-binding protein activator [Rickettsiales bacterium]
MGIWKVCGFALLPFLAGCSVVRYGVATSPRKLDTLDAPRPASVEPASPPAESKIVNRLFDFGRSRPLPRTDYGADYAGYRARESEEEKPVVEIGEAPGRTEPVPVEAPRGSDGFLRIAVLSPDSSAQAAAEIRNAAMLAMFNVRSDRVILQFYDSKGTSDGARAAARAAASEGASVVVGPLFADEVRGVRQASVGVSAISFTTDQGALGSGIFSIGFLLEQQISRIVEYAVASGRSRFALVLPKSDTGDFIRGAFKRYADRFGGEIVAEESYRKDTAVEAVRDVSGFERRSREYAQYVEDVKKRLEYLRALRDSSPDEYSAAYDAEQYASSDAELAALEKLDAELPKKTTVSDPDYDAIFVYGDDINDAIMIGSTLMYYDVHPDRIKFMGTAQLENSKVYGERAFRGAWYPSVSTRYSPQFESAYKRYFGATPGRIASLAYDAVALAATIGGKGSIESFDILNPNGWTGINGIFRFRPDGRSERNIDVREIVGGSSVKTKVVSPAASSFVGN